MTRSFTFKDAKFYIKSIKEILNQVSSLLNYQTNKAKEITSLFNQLHAANYFSEMANNYLLGKEEIKKNDHFDKLVLLINQYILSEDIINHLKELKIQIENDTLNDITTLSSGKNLISWAFSSSKKKESVSKAYEALSSYANSYIMDETKETIGKLNELSKQSISEALNHFENNKTIYDKAIRKIINTKDNKPILKISEELLLKQKQIQAKIDDVESENSSSKDEIKKSIDILVANELLKLLKTIPVEELNRDKKGIRVKPLIDNGYTNMADVYTANVYNLSAVYGISQDNAYTIKRIANEYAIDARKEIKIKLSFDDQNKLTTEIVKGIYNYRKKESAYKLIEDQKNKHGKYIEYAIKVLRYLWSGRFWAFYEDEHKAKAKRCYEQFGQMLYGNYGIIINEAYDRYNAKLSEASKEEAWNDFKDHSIDYYNVIGIIAPGVLGNSDTLYGLPEDLAKEVQEQCFFPDGLLCTLRRYQEWGVKYILHQEKVLLGDEMGLGKTVQAIATMVSLRNTGATHFAVVCPASVVTNWCREIVKHSKLKVMKAHGRFKKEVVRAWVKTGGVIVTTYESTSVFELDPYFRFEELIVDEAHYIKNKGAARTTRVLHLAKHAKRLLFMTGTALENRVDEMISLIEDLNPNVASSIKNIAFMSTAPQFREKVAPVYYRRKREDVLTELPDLIESEEWCTLNAEETMEYEKAILSKNAMAARRVSFNVDDLSLSSKMNRLKEIIEDAKNDDRKVLVFSFFLNTIDKICEALGTKVCLNPINGSVNPNRRQEIIDEFEKAPAGTVLCAQIQSGGTGLNIQAASVVIICEPQIKPSIENQAISRAYRMGQSRNVQVFRLLCENTIDERILDLLKEKQEIFDAFADKSVAADNVEIDEKGLGDIIKEEIDRINKKRESQGNENVTPVAKWEKAKEVYTGKPVSVTKRMEQVSQAIYGGYINPNDMEVFNYPIKKKLNEEENISPQLMGLAVDYLTRYMISGKIDAFKIPLMGAMNLDMVDKAKQLIFNIGGLDDVSVINAIKLVGFDAAYRAGINAYKPIEDINPDNNTIENVKELVYRAINFLKVYGPVIEYGYSFDGGYTKVIGKGDGDFMTKDTLWDFKVSIHKPTNDNTFQLLIYYIMGLHSKNPNYKNIKYVGIYNPRVNKAYRYDVSKIDSEIIKRVEEEVIGY